MAAPRRNTSPAPVALAATVPFLAYVPAPTTGESPTRPAILFVMPPVEVAAARSRFPSTATAPTVPWVSVSPGLLACPFAFISSCQRFSVQ